MIPRYQKILFYSLLGLAILMAALLIRQREKAHDKLLAQVATPPTSAPEAASPENVQFLIANDADGTLFPVARQIPLPEEPGARARVLLRKLLEFYGDPHSTHPISISEGVDQVFLMPMPKDASGKIPGQIAVVNLKGSFADAHPSGIEVETLTILSILGTLHTNLPQVLQVRFLVDGQPRQTLAGHADLTRAYLTGDSTTAQAAGVQP